MVSKNVAIIPVKEYTWGKKYSASLVEHFVAVHNESLCFNRTRTYTGFALWGTIGIVVGGITVSNTVKEKLIDATAEYGGAAAGAAIGAGIGTAVAGPAGAVGGSILGTAIEKAFVWAGKEIKERCLSTAENKKIGTVYDAAKQSINEKLNSGMLLRTDDFFCAEIGDRSSAEEILEGTLFAAQRENEEKKLLYLSNLYANINFDDTVSRPMANQLVKIASNISYRQLVILSVIGKNHYGILNVPLRDTAFRGFEDFGDMSIAAEIFDLYRMSLIISSSAILDAASFVPSLLVLNGMGQLLYSHMELFNIPQDDTTQTVIDFLSNDAPIPPSDNVVTGELPTTTWEEIDALFEKKTADIPRIEIETTDSISGGQTVIFKDRRFTDEEAVCEALSKI